MSDPAIGIRRGVNSRRRTERRALPAATGSARLRRLRFAAGTGRLLLTFVPLSFGVQLLLFHRPYHRYS